MTGSHFLLVVLIDHEMKIVRSIVFLFLISINGTLSLVISILFSFLVLHDTYVISIWLEIITAAVRPCLLWARILCAVVITWCQTKACVVLFFNYHIVSLLCSYISFFICAFAGCIWRHRLSNDKIWCGNCSRSNGTWKRGCHICLRKIYQTYKARVWEGLLRWFGHNHFVSPT